MNHESLIASLSGPEFELLVRRFSMAQSGEDRGHKKQAIINFVLKALDASGSTQDDGPAQNKMPVAWARKWHVDGEKPVKTKNKNGRWHWGKFRFHALTPNQIFPDDVPLYACKSTEAS